MSDQNTTTGDPTDPRPPCGICKSTDHTTGFHDGGKAAEGFHDGGSAPKFAQ